ncbi:MAG: hypothetical protein A3I77_01835 [Gammaproteobacteria bacterium RIFCSPLOWO2_02_FULL_42_14]|nr:MAG: hypothetical protein A3B71_04445 [Gammaproteobacteria bacterium RIFCSPHIGHO2_02_FULL_42_43]OGT29273.1 MAG: hypothetical protein A2624_07365 [Gammaproteobacteria bacterium RIFCSPHIGHO2_01_FULL_42_8]OGT50868.1 MAG: hypothetical protein A3E54_03785 [Gammaproteobacteria bacterium RIFCSPHIGHO2_12_FULL_41_25]OGT62537.1 MAG: hypothetical protein A3I77_01835 [Gammaproteobacteria bacterium RIFCSPLOWO2_02_FULL_42_14]OGT86521.1 MAG: hypothetical protein A3G86_08355 [Gammaproteobacteria bacterium R
MKRGPNFFTNNNRFSAISNVHQMAQNPRKIAQIARSKPSEAALAPMIALALAAQMEKLELEQAKKLTRAIETLQKSPGKMVSAITSHNNVFSLFSAVPATTAAAPTALSNSR